MSRPYKIVIRVENRPMQSIHIMNAFEQELKFLASRIASMGGHAERMGEQAVQALGST